MAHEIARQLNHAKGGGQGQDYSATITPTAASVRAFTHLDGPAIGITIESFSGGQAGACEGQTPPLVDGRAQSMKRRLTIVYMGDSITFGQYVDSGLRWTSLVSEKLREQLADTGPAFETHNKGIGGDTTRMALERYTRDFEALRPDVMTLQFGLNDCNCWQTDRGVPRVPEAAFKANRRT